MGNGVLRHPAGERGCDRVALSSRLKVPKLVAADAATGWVASFRSGDRCPSVARQPTGKRTRSWRTT